MLAGDSAPGRSNHVGPVKGERPDKSLSPSQILGSPCYMRYVQHRTRQKRYQETLVNVNGQPYVISKTDRRNYFILGIYYMRDIIVTK